MFSHSGLISAALAAEIRGDGTSGLAEGSSTSPLPYHWNSRSKPLSWGPAMYPSSDIVAPVMIFPMACLLRNRWPLVDASSSAPSFRQVVTRRSSYQHGGSDDDADGEHGQAGDDRWPRQRRDQEHAAERAEHTEPAPPALLHERVGGGVGDGVVDEDPEGREPDRTAHVDGGHDDADDDGQGDLGMVRYPVSGVD